MKHKLFASITAAAALTFFPASHLFAQTSGISNPEAVEDASITTSSGGLHYDKPVAVSLGVAAPVPPPRAPLDPNPLLHLRTAQPGEPAPIVYGAYRPYVAPSSAPSPAVRTTPTSEPAPAPAPLLSRAAKPAPAAPVSFAATTSSLVVYGPYKPYRANGEAPPADLPLVTISEGTVLEASLQQPLSTQKTHEGDHFTAALQSDYSANGSLLLPAGSLVHGRITRIHGGHLIGGNSAIHLQPDTVSLPDGTVYRINAEVSGLDHARISHVNNEGTIVGNLNAKATAGVLGFTTGSTVVVGAMIGSGVGAVVGLGVGAGIATVWWLKQDRQLAIPAGTEIEFTLGHSMKAHPVIR
jgi:hypothetical protein